MVWGGNRLNRVLNKPFASDEPHGESWEVSDHPAHRTVVGAGPHDVRTYHTFLETESRAFLGVPASACGFPWLIKFLDANDWLSVQVHPDEIAVKTLWPGEGSKTEAWFVLDAAPGSLI